MNIALVGFMGTGKTVVAKRLAKRLGMKYLDLDDVIESDDGRRISQIFAEDGESYFRSLEKKAARSVSKLGNQVIATGGGVVLDEENVRNLKQNGVMICLTATPEIIYARVKDAPHRPLLNIPDPVAKINELLDFRAPYYAKADFTIDTSKISVDEITDKILELIKRKSNATNKGKSGRI